MAKTTHEEAIQKGDRVRVHSPHYSGDRKGVVQATKTFRGKGRHFRVQLDPPPNLKEGARLWFHECQVEYIGRANLPDPVGPIVPPIDLESPTTPAKPPSDTKEPAPQVDESTGKQPADVHSEKNDAEETAQPKHD